MVDNRNPISLSNLKEGIEIYNDISRKEGVET